jgi:LCP family protein required for cell wall assembly
MKIKSILKPESLISIIFFVISYVLMLVLFLSTLRFSQLNFTLYFSAFILLFVAILAIGIGILEGIFRKHRLMKWLSIAGLSFILMFLSVANYYVYNINRSINQVIVNPNQSTEFETAFVTYQNDALTLSSLNNRRLGILSNDQDNDRNWYVKEEVENQALNVTYVEYTSFMDLLLGLFQGEIDVAALPSDYARQFGEYEGFGDYLQQTRSIHTFVSSKESSNQGSDINVTKSPFTVLIIGNDGGRSDTLILASFNPVKLTVTMTSIPRDLYVPIACYPNQASDKIGHAFSVSRDCTIDTIENFLGFEIDYFVEVNFKGVVEIVDALDRIWVYSPVSFVGQNSDEQRGFYNVWVPEGWFWAEGEMALALARERYNMPGGDYQRQINQQQVIQAIINRMLETRDINRAVDVLRAAGNNVKTNMSLDQMMTLFDYLNKSISLINIDPSYLMTIQNSRIMGYPSYFYNEALQLPLWILRPYEGSIADNQRFIRRNFEPLELQSEINMQFDAVLVFYIEDFLSKSYNELEVHEKLPDFMPRMANNDWVLNKAVNWAKQRNIPLTVNFARPGSELYNANLSHNSVVSQSVRYGVLVRNISNLTISIVKHDLDCTLSQNQEYDECKYRLPNFEEQNSRFTPVSTAISWFRNLNLNVVFEYKLIRETDPRYDQFKIGFVIKQEPLEWEDARTLDRIIFTVMDPNYSVTIPNTSTWRIDDARLWVSDNLASKDNIIIRYVPTLDVSQVERVRLTIPATNAKIKFEDKLIVEVFELGYQLGNYVNQTQSAVQDELCSTNVLICRFVNVSTTDNSQNNLIKQQSMAPNTLKTFRDWKTIEVIFEVYKFTSTPSSPMTP